MCNTLIFPSLLCVYQVDCALNCLYACLCAFLCVFIYVSVCVRFYQQTPTGLPHPVYMISLNDDTL